MNKAATIILLLLAHSLVAQVTFVVDSIPPQTPNNAAIYVAGDFNGWNPGDKHDQLAKDTTGKYAITLQPRPEGTEIKYKFTRGSWGTVEKGAWGEELENRQFTYGNKDTVHVKILNWADMAGGGGGESTADTNVHIMAGSFYMPQLGRYRRIWVYLPPDYYFTDKNYPVLYMHDGQNLFDDQTSFAGEWKVDETLNALYKEGKRVPLVIGIDNGGNKRIDELTPWVNPKYGGGEGKKYVRFIVETLKPYVDSLYRTLPDRKNTAIMGSSLGGLISDYAALAYQDVFGMAGLFSPSFWFSDSIWSFTRAHPATKKIRFYLLCGSDESSDMVPEMLAMKDSLVSAGFDSSAIMTTVVPGGRHNEKLWRGAFGKAWLWLSGQETTGIAKFSSKQGNIRIWPNPVEQKFYLDYSSSGTKDRMEVFDSQGRKVLQVNAVRPGEVVDVNALPSGFYIARITSGKTLYVVSWMKK